MKCPRRAENATPFKYDEDDKWYEDDTCSYCGSYNPDKLMEEIRQGFVEVGPTDKNYKVYLTHFGVKRDGKFYFQHFSKEQMLEFIDQMNGLYGGPGLRIGYPGYFYVLPFFIGNPKKKEPDTLF